MRAAMDLLLLAGLAAGMLPSSPASAQSISGDYDSALKYHLYSSAKFDPAIAAEIGFGYRLQLPELDRSLTVGATYSIAVFATDDDTLLAFAQMMAVRSGGWGVPVELGAQMSRESSNAFSGRSVGLKAAIHPGYYGDGWFTAAEIIYAPILAAYIRHSSFVRLMNPELQDGWYAISGGNLNFGVGGGYTFDSAYELSLRAGLHVSQAFNVALVPFYVGLGFNYHFGS